MCVTNWWTRKSYSCHKVPFSVSVLQFLGFSFHCIIRICVQRCCFVRAIHEGSVNAGNELLILDPYSVCLWPPAPYTLTIDEVNARSFTCLCKIDVPNSSPRSEPKSRGGRAPLGEKKLPANSCLALMLRLLCSMTFKDLVNVSSQRALIPGSDRCTLSRSPSDKHWDGLSQKFHSEPL